MIVSATKIKRAGDALTIVDEYTFAASNSDNNVGLYSIATGELVKEFTGHIGKPYTLASDGVHIYSGGYDTTVRSWHIQSGQFQWSFDYGTRVYKINLLNSRKLIVAGEMPARVVMLNTNDGSVLYSISDHTALVHQVLCTEDYIITVGFDCVRVRNHNLQEIRSFSQGNHYSATVMENQIIALCVGTIVLYNMNTGECISRHNIRCSRLAYYGVPGMLVIGRADGTLAYYDVITQQVTEFRPHFFTEAVRAIAVML